MLMKNKKNICSIALIIGFVLVLSSCTRLEILSQQVSETVVQTNGEDDYSIKYAVSVRNKGSAGKVRAKARLFTPEGQFYREQIIALKEGEEQDLKFVFTEPSFLGALFGEGKTRAEFSYELIR